MYAHFLLGEMLGEHRTLNAAKVCLIGTHIICVLAYTYTHTHAHTYTIYTTLHKDNGPQPLTSAVKLLDPFQITFLPLFHHNW